MGSSASDRLLARAVFLDRDGVLNRAVLREGLPYPPASLDEVELLPGVQAACRRLKAAGFLLVVATNQPDVGRGTQSQAVVEAIHAHLCRLLPLDWVAVCYHPGQGASNCPCRKPKPGLLLGAAQALGIDLTGSWMVGDRWRDIDCGHGAGCRTILIDYGYAEPLRQQPHYRCANLWDASQIILAHASDTAQRR